MKRNNSKKHLNELAAIAKQAEKLNQRIHKLMDESNDLDYCPNNIAIRNVSWRLSQLLHCDMSNLGIISYEQSKKPELLYK